MSLEQEKPTNSFEQPSSTGIEGFEVSQSSLETTPSNSEVTAVDIAEELSMPVVEKIQEAPTSSNPITEAQILGEKTLDLFNITEKNVGEAGNANKITDKLNDYKAAA